jgi:hypothetical protein
MLLKLRCNEQLSNFALNFNLRRSDLDAWEASVEALAALAEVGQCRLIL